MSARMVTLLALQALCLVVPAAAGRRLPRLRRSVLATLPMHMYKQDCFKKSSLALAQLGEEKGPGAGMDPSSITPFAQVLKDGFYQVECVRDYMLYHGDKHGDNKFSYELGQVSNVSIVHYADVVPHEDREPMSHTACFAFCRTVPEMLFFGIHNGRDCYCAPYYKPMADDSSMCDSVCEGDQSTMCGGKSKSTVFQMHACMNTQADLANSLAKMEGVAGNLATDQAEAARAAAEMQGAAAGLQPVFGAAGDPVASSLLQAAKAFAGELEQASQQAQAIAVNVAALKGKHAGAAGGDLSALAGAQEAEALVRQMEQATAEAEASEERLEALLERAAPGAPAGAPAAQYYSVMYYVNRSATSDPSTCGGEPVGKPLLGSPDTCAAACDMMVGACIGFSHFPVDTKPGLCFLFAKFTTATHYTGCTGLTSMAQCRIKFARVEGTSMAPDGSGRCKQCLKDVTQADRCFR